MLKKRFISDNKNKKMKYFTILLLLLYFGSNKCRLGEQKRIIFKKHLTNLTVQTLLTGSVYFRTLFCHFLHSFVLYFLYLEVNQ